MPKIKTKSGAAKRIKKLKSGVFKRFKAYKSHLLGFKDRKRKRNLKKPTLVAKANLKTIKRLLPN
ncbi:MAG: 50S ribosomal protein L35 [Deltaproteobacteria bacterium]|nr:50S ribosomal protein L35 [Deltaproteobacteria bacterium]